MLAGRNWVDPFQGILEVLPIRPHGCVAHQLGSYRCRKRIPTARSAAQPLSRCWPRPARTPAEGSAPLPSHPHLGSRANILEILITPN